MEFKTNEEVVEFVKANSKAPSWVGKAREINDYLKALVLGINFKEVLIHKLEKIESDDRQISRKKYSKDIRDLFSRILEPRSNIFTASGGSLNINQKIKKEKLLEHIESFKGQKSLHKYLAENFFRLADTDPNGIIFVEYKGEEEIYPTYKSIHDIRNYDSNGQLINWILFEPIKTVIDGRSVLKQRFVTGTKDYTFIVDGEDYQIVEDETFEHPFGKVPAVILSDLQEMGSELRVTSLYPILELADEYAIDKSIKGLYKKFHGFPRHWRYVQHCRKCTGTGKTGKDTCSTCNGTGLLGNTDVTDVLTLEIPRDSDSAIITPHPEGYISPDLATWEQMNSELKNLEELVEATMWGTSRVKEATNETATGRFLDVQPIMTKLDWFTDNVEFVDNTLLKFVENWVNGKPKKESEVTHIYGRRFIIESPDVLTERYNEDRLKGANVTILDKDLEEILLSKYRNNTKLLARMQKKVNVEPYVHQSIEQVSVIFGKEEAFKKVLFVKFWDGLDSLYVQETDTKELTKQFEAYIEKNKLIGIEQPIEPIM